MDIFLKYPIQSIIGMLIMFSGIKMRIGYVILISFLFFFIPSRGEDFSFLRKTMVESQIIARGITDKRVINAMLKVPRHIFVPEEYKDEAYNDYPLPIGYGQTISQPYIVALMTEALKLKENDKVLEIGTGSGYQTAILAEIVKYVYSIEIIKELAIRAKKTLDILGYKNIHIKIGNGYNGWPEKAPFDAIIVTCAPKSIPKPLIDQLKDGGRMVIPVGSRYGIQRLMRVKKINGRIHKETLTFVRFVPMIRGNP